MTGCSSLRSKATTRWFRFLIRSRTPRMKRPSPGFWRAGSTPWSNARNQANTNSGIDPVALPAGQIARGSQSFGCRLLGRDRADEACVPLVFRRWPCVDFIPQRPSLLFGRRLTLQARDFFFQLPFLGVAPSFQIAMSRTKAPMTIAQPDIASDTATATARKITSKALHGPLWRRHSRAIHGIGATDKTNTAAQRIAKTPPAVFAQYRTRHAKALIAAPRGRAHSFEFFFGVFFTPGPFSAQSILKRSRSPFEQRLLGIARLLFSAN